FRHFDFGGEILRHRIRERELAALNHIGKQQRREYLRNRADFEDGIAAEWPRVALIERAMRYDPPSPGLDNSHHDSNPLVIGIDALDQDVANLGVGRRR